MAVPLSRLLGLACLLACVSCCIGDLIGEICPQSRNPSFCDQALRSDRRSASADYRGLGLIAIDLAQGSAKSAQKLVTTLSKQAKDPELKGRYSSCAENFEDATDNLDSCRGFLKNKDTGSLSTYASAAFTDADTCDDNFESPPSEPIQVKQASQKVQDLCSVILVITKRL